MEKIKVITNIAIVIALYFLTYHTYNGIINPNPPLGDSWDYHIPIAQTIIDGRFLNPQNFLFDQWYYPGSAELLNVFLIFFNLPLSFSNILASVVLFFALFKLGRVFKLEKYYSILFALSFVTLNVVVRWLNFALVDVWVSVFFVLAIILLENPKKRVSYFLKLGFILGMLVGSKYTAVFFLIPLFIFYTREIIKVLKLKNILMFLIPFSIFGLFWYFRNFYYMGNPFYPLGFFNFPSVEIFANHRVWNVFIDYPVAMTDSFFAEFKLWTLSLPFAVFYLIYRLYKRNFKLDNISKLFILGIINFIFFLNFPTSPEPWIMVSSFRYAYPIFIPIFLAIFLLSKKYKKEELLGYFVIGNMIFVTSLNYYPKLTLIFIPLSLICFYFLEKKKLF
jgi:hypothetical protein